MTLMQVQGEPGRTIRQERSRKTYEAFISAGFRLLEKDEFESMTIAGLAEAAGYSVGAFYARFQSKDEFFEAMVAQHLRRRTATCVDILANVPRDELVATWIEDLVEYYWSHRRFWRAVLLRSTNDPEFWAPIENYGKGFVESVRNRIQKDIRRQLSRTESDNVRFAVHVILSMVNNRIVNRPKPSLLGHSTFVENLTRAFNLVSDYQALDGAAPGVR